MTEQRTPTILDDKIGYERWRKITHRRVKMRNGKVVEFDLVGNPNDGDGVMVFAWDTKSKTATLVREYMPGPHRTLWGLAAGVVEVGEDIELAARRELEEETHLVGGKWIPLCEKTAMGKYDTMVCHTFLVMDAELASDPKPLDDEEDIEIHPGIPIKQVLEYVYGGQMDIVRGWGSLLAIQKLREMGEIE